tara:strand:- start:3370 stop:3558 length:189 start_codon:yes stop_codon:yes gene_type:complete
MRAEELENIKANDSYNNGNNKVDLNDLMQKVRDEEKKSKRSNIIISAAVLSIIAVFGLILTF